MKYAFTIVVLFLILLAIDMIVLGVFRIIAGITANEFPTWFRIFSIIIGILMVLFAILILITPVWGAIFVIMYIGMVLVIAGIMRLIMAFLPE